MTVTVKCQYTGIEFEAKSKRSKNHPQVAALLAEANKNRTYSAVKDALTEGQELGFETIDEYIEFARAAMFTANAKFTARMNQMRAERKAKQEAKRHRDFVNAKLRKHGYTWRKNFAYDHDHYEESDGTFEWELWSEDGRQVTVEQALAEIEAL